MKLGAYQFPVSGDIGKNMEKIKAAAALAASEGVRLLAFPECAVTGYPPRDIPSSAEVDLCGWKMPMRNCRALSTI